MSLTKLTCACLLVTAAAAIFTIAFGTEQAAKPEYGAMQTSICALYIRIVHTAAG